MTSGYSVEPLAAKKILLAHSNIGANMMDWHERRRLSAVKLGYDLSVFCMTDYHPYTIFPYLDRKWRKRDSSLMKLYEALGEAIDACDVFIHYNGALIHPEFLQQFDKVKIYHCADDPDASKVLSEPVARHYDICAISNPACIDMYKSWGCEDTFFWPIGAYHYLCGSDDPINDLAAKTRDIPLVFIGSKFGVTNIRFVGKFLGLHMRKRFMTKIEKFFPEVVAYGSGWSRGWIADDQVSHLYSQTRIGLNVHNSLGPVNARLYDLAAFGVCQICDNKSNLNLVFEEGKEIIGFENIDECVELIRYYSAHREQAQLIGAAGRKRFLKDYSMSSIWKRFFEDLGQIACKKV